MSIKIHKAIIRVNGEKQVIATLRIGWFWHEKWIFVKDPRDERWFARHYYASSAAETRRTLGRSQMAQFLGILPKIRFEDYRDNGWY